MPIEVAYLPSEALNSRPHAAAATIRAVAAQVRRQVPREPDSLALTLPALIDACRAVEVNGKALAVSWELGRALQDELGQAVLGLCDIDAHEPGWAYIAVNGPMTANSPDLALSTAAHELGHLLFDVPAALARGEQRYHAVASSPRALERAGRGAEARANEFMGALLALSNSAQYFPPNSAQNFPVYAVGFGCFRLCLNRKESFPVSRMSQ